jgi:lipopolysaccharide/colanic/teichoic acid biosynthesis glycosyltransferase
MVASSATTPLNVRNAGWETPQSCGVAPAGRMTSPHAGNRCRPVARIRRQPTPPISLAQCRLAAGEAFVSPGGNLAPAYLAAKRGLDIVGALILLVLLSPVMLFSLCVLLVTTRGRPIFRQVRLGCEGRPFVLYKFRTMAVDAEKRIGEVANEHVGPAFKNRRDPRITRFGRLLRRTSIDETPQLLNVLAGQMSLVGPRPSLPSEVARYSPWHRRRLSVCPGLTCLWQVSGRSEIAFDDWVRMDLWYVRNQSIRTDLGLLLKTPWSVLTCRGAY